jgi:hypothetical protein
VFVDGRYLGQTSSVGRLSLRLAAGAHQFRLTESGFSDGVFDVELPAGKHLVVDVGLLHLSSSAQWRSPSRVRLSVGQPVRGHLGENGLSPDYVVHMKASQRLMVTVVRSGVEYEVIGPDRKPVTLTQLSRPAGTPGSSWLEWKASKAGEYTLRCKGKSRRFFSFRLGMGLTALVKDPQDPLHKGRRVAPRLK